jgi:hypothetical protein
MSTTTPPRGPAPHVPETLTQEHHDALKRSWELPAYVRARPPVPRWSHRTRNVALVSGAVGLAVGAGLGLWVQSERIAELEARPPIAVTTTVPTTPGYSVLHDSRIIEAPRTTGFGRWTRPVITRTVNPP